MGVGLVAAAASFGDLDHQFPRWTPNSSSLLYFSPAHPGDRQGTLYLIPALGGQAKPVVKSLGGGDVRASDNRLTYFRLAEEKVELVTSALDGSGIEVVKGFDSWSNFMHPAGHPTGSGSRTSADSTSIGRSGSSRLKQEASPKN